MLVRCDAVPNPVQPGGWEGGAAVTFTGQGSTAGRPRLSSEEVARGCSRLRRQRVLGPECQGCSGAGGEWRVQLEGESLCGD